MESRIETFVFYDCETTGLEQWSRITEMSLVAVQTNHLLRQSTTNVIKLPRVLNKLSLCLNPNKVIHPAASDITGLYNDMLEKFSHFNKNTVDLLQQFLIHLPQPVCLVAHNGSRFDFTILKNHILKLPQAYNIVTSMFDKLLVVDTLQLFRQHHKIQLERLQLEEEEIEKELTSSPTSLVNDCDIISDEDFFIRGAQRQKINETTPTKKDQFMSNSVDNSSLYAQPVQNNTRKQNEAASSRKKLNFRAKMPSFKLSDVYQRMTGMQPVQNHEAEADVIMLAKCAVSMGGEFVSLANFMAIPFMDAK